MAVKLVTYDLNREVVRPAITKRLKERWPEWAMLSESSYVIETHMDHSAVYHRLRPLLDENDALFVDFEIDDAELIAIGRPGTTLSEMRWSAFKLSVKQADAGAWSGSAQFANLGFDALRLSL